jgi:hypothetical protein
VDDENALADSKGSGSVRGPAKDPAPSMAASTSAPALQPTRAPDFLIATLGDVIQGAAIPGLAAGWPMTVGYAYAA